MGALIDVNIKGVRHLCDYMTTMANRTKTVSMPKAIRLARWLFVG